MFFSGDPSTRKRVDLGGRSSKERDRQNLLEQTRLERNRRLWLRQQNSAATKIQKCFRGRKVMEAERSNVRESFFRAFGDRLQNIDRHCFGPDSDFLRQLLFFVNPRYAPDFFVLVETCKFFQKFVRESGDVFGLFSGAHYYSLRALVDHRVRQFAYMCIRAVHVNRSKLIVLSEESIASVTLLLDSVALLLDSKLPWACNTVSYLQQRNLYSLIREITLTAKEKSLPECTWFVSSLEHVLTLVVSHLGQRPCYCPRVDPRQSFYSQMLTIPLFWKLFPRLKEIFATLQLSKLYLSEMSVCIKNHTNVLPLDVSKDFPGHACLLGNLLEAAVLAFAHPDPFDVAVDFATVATYLFHSLPLMQTSNLMKFTLAEDESIADDEIPENVINKDLEQQICNAIDPRFLVQLTNVLFGGFPFSSSSDKDRLKEKELAAIGAACAFLNASFSILPVERIMTVLAYRTELVPVLWNFIKKCHESRAWSSFAEQLAYLPADAPGWLLPLAVFCPVYKHMLMIVDNEEFYEQEKPLSLKDIRCLIVILKQALWQVLWPNAMAPSDFVKSTHNVLALKRQPEKSLQQRVCVVASELLSQLQDWNNRRQFMPPTEFYVDGVDEYFISQARTENTKANDILKQAPFLVPFTVRAKIFTSQLAAARGIHDAHGIFARNRFRIRRDRILEDAFSQLSALSEEDLRGRIRVTFVNEFGVEEAGIDGGGIFKDFMENITRAAFDVHYGLFKETADHLLYPNPGSGLIHEQHLQYFNFLGTILAKAMFEGILVDIPFATFFLSKLKQKYNYLNDLPSLDPELYRHLIFLKRYEGDISELELYFVIVNNEYGEQVEEELLPGGKDKRVTNENVITFIHLVANHRLNFQIRQQSSHFLRGFQQLIQKDWINMFNEHELQLLISGSVDGFDIDDLRANTTYSGGYHEEHYVIDMFWEVVKSLSLENQRKFLKFVTGCSRGPLLGFRYLQPKFGIQRAAGDASEEAFDRLPTSATCMNLLKLPPYRSKEQMEQKLLYSINADAGFDLS